MVITIVFPWMRQLSFGDYLPDAWLLLLLLAVPTPMPHSARKPIILALCLALLRSSVALCSPIASCASLLSALMVRESLTRLLSDSLFVYRFSCAVLSAVPMALIDISIASQHQIELSYTTCAWRVLLTGFIVALVKRRSSNPMFGGKS
ncbi:MAG: hypothetical protein HOD03_06660 [Planctomycetes bacterium]|nr:hypothetical protein [Planctomycetota bacterium]